MQLLLLYKSRTKGLQNILFLPSHQRGNYRMKIRLSSASALFCTALAAAPFVQAAEDGMEAAGRQLFTHHCTACHSLDTSENAFGPSLFGVVGRPAASVPRFAYSNAMQASGITWTEDNLRKWIADNEALVRCRLHSPRTGACGSGALAATVAACSSRDTPMLPPDRRPATATLILLASLYCAQGLPSGLLAHALPVLLRQHGVDLALIGLLKLLALPWLLKVLWAHWVDRLASRHLGHHRGWILPLQLTLIAIVTTLALLTPQLLFDRYFLLLIGLLLLVNLAAATQDIATDGLTVRLLPERWRGLGNSLQVGGYKVGMLVSGSGLLLAMDWLGWHLSLGLVAALLVLMTVPIWRFAENRQLPFQPALAEPAGPGLLLRHYRGLLLQPGMLLWLVVLLSFKLGDALGSPMIKPMLVDQGWSNADLGQLTLISSLVGIAGALLGGLLYTRIGALRALLLFGLLQAAGIAATAWLVGAGGQPVLVYAVALFEQAADGMSTVALFAVMMRQCRPEHEGADFTLQASVQLLLAGLVGASSGWLAEQLGFASLFISAGVLGLLALPIVLLYFWRGARLAPRGA